MPAMMCTGEDCEVKESCYRFTAEPYKQQDYFTRIPFYVDNCRQLCDYYVPNYDEEA